MRLFPHLNLCLARLGQVARRQARLALTLVCLLAFSLPLLACDAFRTEEIQEVARYGSGGRNLALRLVEAYPFRAPGSPEEAETADFIVQELQSYGYQPEVQKFSYTSPEGQTRQSQNIVVNIPGRGFQKSEQATEEAFSASRYNQVPANLQDLYVLAGAHYDTAYSRSEAQAYDQQATEAQVDEDGNPINTGPQLPPMLETDGLDDNAAAVASLLTLAVQLKVRVAGSPVRLVFFGAGHDDYAGAKAYAQSLSPEDLQNIKAMVNLERIYAGDKVYAHAGQNSVMGGEQKNYALRYPLYLCTDVYYNNLLLTNNGFALFTNQAGCRKDLPGVGSCIYREWTETKGNHTPFDNMGVPVVFFESADYNLENCEVPVKESNDPSFSATGGMIAGTPYDSSKLLLQYFVPEGQIKRADFFGKGNSQPEEESTTTKESLSYVELTDALEIRINNLAFIMSELASSAPLGWQVKR